MRKLVTAGALCALLTACVPPQQAGQPGQFGMNNTTGGTLVGAGLGGLVGNQFGGGAGKGVMTLAGVLVGGLIGSKVGAAMDQADTQAAAQNTQAALENNRPNQPLPWKTEQGHSGTVVPGRVWQTPTGQYCREFQQTITIGGETQQGYGTACRQPDGTWQIVRQ